MIPQFLRKPESFSSRRLPLSIELIEKPASDEAAEGEAGQMLTLEIVNSNVVGVTDSLPLKEFAEVHKEAPTQIFEQKLEGDWEH
jgi:hypothetical protein